MSAIRCAAIGAGSARNSSTSRSMPGQAGVSTWKPRAAYRCAQCSQLREVIQSPWMSTIVSTRPVGALMSSLPVPPLDGPRVPGLGAGNPV